MGWTHDARCLLSRYQVDPARWGDFIAPGKELFAFAGMKNGRAVFGQYPPGRSDIYQPRGSLGVRFL